MSVSSLEVFVNDLWHRRHRRNPSKDSVESLLTLFRRDDELFVKNKWFYFW